MADTDRHARGLAVMEKLFGSAPVPNEANAEMLGVTIEHLFGDIWTRPGLDHRDRELITVSVIAALGFERQLRVHVRGALNAGVTRDEIKELMLHVAHYAGWPSGFNGISVAREVFEEIDAA
ncbi:MAG: carboxymuconolactone decarboxylase family protein [Alphaproteobacteria bacterium]|nr:carboxymuconolactone decarboxylase family protein [Alphaproteobacteria bacterium]